MTLHVSSRLRYKTAPHDLRTAADGRRQLTLAVDTVTTFRAHLSSEKVERHFQVPQFSYKVKRMDALQWPPLLEASLEVTDSPSDRRFRAPTLPKPQPGTPFSEAPVADWRLCRRFQTKARHVINCELRRKWPCIWVQVPGVELTAAWKQRCP
jgi:hypothetical protein